MTTECILLVLILCVYQSVANTEPFSFEDTLPTSTEMTNNSKARRRVIDTPLIIIFCGIVFIFKIILVILVYKFVIKGAKPKILELTKSIEDERKDNSESHVEIELKSGEDTHTDTKDSNRFYD